MHPFITLACVALLIFCGPLGILAAINYFRHKQPGCSGSHDCVVYKGRKVMCPSCELCEIKARLKIQQQT